MDKGGIIRNGNKASANNVLKLLLRIIIFIIYGTVFFTYPNDIYNLEGTREGIRQGYKNTWKVALYFRVIK